MLTVATVMERYSLYMEHDKDNKPLTIVTTMHRLRGLLGRARRTCNLSVFCPLGSRVTGGYSVHDLCTYRAVLHVVHNL